VEHWIAIILVWMTEEDHTKSGSRFIKWKCQV